MKTILTLLFAFLSGLIYAQDSSFTKGNEAYSAGDFETALAEYNKLVGNEKMSSDLFYNLGNTYFKLNELGEAIWAYEKALKINPDNEDALFNLKFANESTYDEIDSSDSAIANWLKINLFSYSINLWSVLSIVFMILFSLVLFVFFTTQNQKLKNTFLTIGFGSLFLLILTSTLAYLNKAEIMKQTEAIVTIEFIEVRTSPSETAPEGFKLHEGTKVDLLRSNENWVEVSVNGNAGWVPKESVWEI